ncbi:CvpA family protein [Lachnospiraceae bacterium 62-35]
MNIIMEHWLSFGIAAFLTGMVLYGHYRGFIRQAVAIGALAASIILTNLFIPQVKAFLKENVAAREMIKNVFMTNIVWEEEKGENEPSIQRSYIENLELPEQLKTALLENNNSEVYELLGVEHFADYIIEYLSNTILSGIAYVVVFSVTFFMIHLIMRWLNIIAKLPILSGLNKIAGAGVGFAEGLLLIWIACLVLTVFAGTPWGMMLIQQIEKSTWLSFLYNHNFLLQAAMGIIYRAI